MTHDDVGWEVPEHPVGVDKPLVVHDRVQRAELAVELSPLEHGGDTALEMVRFAGLDARQYSKFGEPGATVLDAGQVTVDVQREHALARGDRCGDALGQILDNPLAGGRVVVGTHSVKSTCSVNATTGRPTLDGTAAGILHRGTTPLSQENWECTWLSAGSILPIVAWPRVVAHLTIRYSPAGMSVVCVSRAAVRYQGEMRVSARGVQRR